MIYLGVALPLYSKGRALEMAFQVGDLERVGGRNFDSIDSRFTPTS